jgi:hypothetical protein
MLKKLFVSVLSLFAISVFANPGFITHKIINKTNQDFDFILRQVYMPAIYGCTDHIAASSEKTCSGEFDNSNSLFIIEYFKNSIPKTDNYTTLKISGLANKQTLSLNWTIVPKGTDNFEVKVTLG